MLTRIAFSGLFFSGKDYVAAQAGFRILSVATPMYRICEYFFGHCDKQRSDIRKFLQDLGQWGSGYDNQDEAPCTFERAAITHLLRTQGANISLTSGPWEDFGKQRDFWISILLESIDKLPSHDRLAVTNLRFPHEQVPLREAGFAHYLVLCSEETRFERAHSKTQAFQTLSQNVSERYARELLKKLPDEQIIWNDHRQMPSGRNYLSVAKFIEQVSQ